MTKKRKYKSKAPQKRKVGEPKVAYGIPEITIVKSFLEMEEHDIIETSSFTPIEHLQHITEFLKNAYAKELKTKMTDLTIRFKKQRHGNTTA